MRVCVFDTETDKLTVTSAAKLDNQPKITEFFGLELKQDGINFEEGAGFQRMFNIGRPVSAESTKITGITEEMLKGCKNFAFHADEMEAYLAGFDVVVAHNLAFDRDVVNYEFARVGKKIKWPRCICTVESTEWLKGYRLNLTALHAELFDGEVFKDAHRAENDVRALARCYMELVKRGIV